MNGCTDPAVAFCYTCQQFMCPFGQISHKRASHLYHHSTMQLDQESATLLPRVIKRSDRYCTVLKHKKQELNFYCYTCSCVICRDCTVVLHNGHDITELSTIAEAHRDEMRESLESAQIIVSRLVGAIDRNRKMVEQVHSSKQDAAMAIEDTFGQVMRTLDERKKRLLSELETIYQSKAASLNQQKEQFETMEQDIGHYTKVTSKILETHTDHEVVALKGLVPSELKAILKKVENVSLLPSEHSYLKFLAERGELINELLKLGSIMDLSPSPHFSPCECAFVATVNTKIPVVVKTLSSKGDAYPCGGLKVMAELRPKSHDGLAVSGDVVDHGDGTYTVTLTPQMAGPHQLLVTMNGQHVQNSPHNLEIRHNYKAICSPTEVMKLGSNPYCIAIHENGDIYVSSSDHSIYIFDQDRQLKGTIGSQEGGNGQFSGPGLFIKGDLMYVADYYNHCIQQWTTDGKLLHQFGEKGSGQGQFNGPWEVIIDSANRVIISDSDNNRVEVFNQSGDWLMTLDGNGLGESAFSDPRGLALDSQGNIYVVANGSNTIKVFSPEGTHIKTYGDVNCPIGIVIDDYGFSFVSERHGNCLSVFDPEGNKIHTVGNLNNPCGIALDTKHGCIYVSNCGGKNVFKYPL